jgi:hypothetical protein
VLGISSDPMTNMLPSLIYILFKEPESTTEFIQRRMYMSMVMEVGHVGYELFTGIKERHERGKPYGLLAKFLH